jgi:hypothetical protein
MKLSKALKLKNKKVQEYNDTLSKMIANNSYDVECKKNYNSLELYEKAKQQMGDLVLLKTSIHTTSEPIRHKIFLLSELKSFLGNIKVIDTKEGLVKVTGYSRFSTVSTGDKPSNYAADINEETKSATIKALEESIENTQEEIDTFNATTDLIGYDK